MMDGSIEGRKKDPCTLGQSYHGILRDSWPLPESHQGKRMEGMDGHRESCFSATYSASLLVQLEGSILVRTDIPPEMVTTFLP